MARGAAVYRFFTADGALLYVGCSYNPFQRWSLHKSDKPWMGDVVRMDVVWFDTHREALLAEAVAIRDEAPRFNIQAGWNGALFEREVIGDGPDRLKAWRRATNKSGQWERVWDLRRAIGIDYNRERDLNTGRRPPAPDVAALIERGTGGEVPASSWELRLGSTAKPIHFVDPERSAKARAAAQLRRARASAPVPA